MPVTAEPTEPTATQGADPEPSARPEPAAPDSPPQTGEVDSPSTMAAIGGPAPTPTERPRSADEPIMLGLMLAEHMGPEPDWVVRSRDIERQLVALRPQFARCGAVPDRARISIAIGQRGNILRASYPTLPEELRSCWDRGVRTLSFPPSYMGQHTVVLDLR